MNKRLCNQLIKADSESKVIKILREYDLWTNGNWKLYGDNENNFSIIGSQQAEPDAALVEKLINSVDAVLTSACLKAGIEPDSPEAPQSMTEAAEQFFGIREGKLSNVDPKVRGKLAQNIHLIASGRKTKPCFTILDKGEGQHAHAMPDTFLSLNKSNKLRIPFVQGKFNMGSTGVLQFCGEHNLQLIVTRKDGDEEWGFTVLRREPPRKGTKSSVYTYLDIKTFKSDFIEANGKSIEHGSLIKLYDYEIKGYRTNIKFDLYNRLSLLIPSLSIPIRMVEARAYKGENIEATLSGIKVRLDEDKRDNLEPGFPSSGKITVKGNELPVSIYAFKKGRSKNYVKKEGIIFTVNGQTHGALGQSFYTRKSVRMGYLQDSILLIVDCSNLDGKYREDLFMNSRDKLRFVKIRSDIEESLEEMVSEHSGLRELRERRRREEIADKLKDSKPFAEILNNIIDTSPTLASLFRTGDRLSSPINVAGQQEAEVFHGTQFPTFFNPLREFSKDSPKRHHKGQKFRVQYITDVVNDYFIRDNQPGSFHLTCEGKEADATVNLWNGYATMNVTLPETAQVGDILHYECIVDDVSQVQPFRSEFWVEVLPEKDMKGDKGQRKKPITDKLALPNLIEVTRNEWDTHGFGELSALKVVDNGEGGFDFFVNMDNLYLLHELKRAKSEELELVRSRFKYALVLIGLSTLNNTNMEESEEYNVYDLIDKFARTVSPVLLPMIEYFTTEMEEQ